MGCTPPQPNKKTNLPHPEPPNLNFDYHPEPQHGQQHSEQRTFSQLMSQSSSQSINESIRKSNQFSSRNSIQQECQRELLLNNSLYSILVINEDINSRENYCQFYKYLDLSQQSDLFPIQLNKPQMTESIPQIEIPEEDEEDDEPYVRQKRTQLVQISEKRSLEDSEFLFFDPPAQVVKLNTHNKKVVGLIQSFKTYERKEQLERTDLPFVVISDGIMTYYGQIENDLKTGFGKALFRDGAYFEGYWSKDKPNYHGRLIHGDGHMYEGEWSMGKAEGFGAFYKDGELRFKGHFKNDLPNKN